MTVQMMCGLCGLPATAAEINGRPYFGNDADGVPLHHGDERTRIIGWVGIRPIYVTCYEAWTVYGWRPIVWAEGTILPEDAPLAEWERDLVAPDFDPAAYEAKWGTGRGVDPDGES
jgi:hypothetical protein